MRDSLRLPALWDFLNAGLVLAAVVAELTATGASAPSLVVSVACALPLAWRRQLPLGALAAVLIGVSVLAIVEPDGEWVTPFAAVLIGLYSVAAYAERRVAAVGLGAVLLFFASGTVLDNLQDPGRRPLGDLVYMSVLNTSAWAIGRIVRRWREQALALAEKTAELERQREWRDKAAAAEERNRIARDLHDVIAHSVSLMVVQAAAAEQVLGDEASPARQPIEQIQETGREAVHELRRLLGVLRSDRDEASMSAQPNLRDLASMVDRATEAGLRTELRIGGVARELPPGIELLAYRLVQEALTNALKYAGPTTACVDLTYGDDDLTIDVVNGPSVLSDGQVNGTGHGLVGMRERVSLYNGVLEAGPLEDGFAVHARIPITGDES